MFDFSKIEVANEKLSKDYLLQNIGEEAIFSYYFALAGGGTLEVGKKRFCNPLRPGDTTPGCFFKWRDNLMFYDFASVKKAYNVFGFVMEMYNCNFKEALRIIYNDFNLNRINKIIENKPKVVHKEVTKFQFMPKPFTLNALKWWGEYLITEEELKRENVYQVDKLWIRDTPYSVDELTFAYYYPEVDRVKIYKPLADKSKKWLSNTQFDYIDTLSELPRVCKDVLIVKSKKDKIIMSKLFSDVCAVTSESPQSISTETDMFFQENYENRIVFFDSDDPGVAASKALNHRGYDWINLDRWLYECHNVKDPSDYVKEWREFEYLKTMLKQKGLVCKI